MSGSASSPVQSETTGAPLPDATPKPVRLFIAIRIPEDVKTELERAQSKWRRSVPESLVRWSKPDQFHLTLKFLGRVEALQVQALSDAVQNVCHGFAPLQLRAVGLGAFPGLRRPRVLWAGIDDAHQQLPPLQKAIEGACQQFTSEKPDEKFHGHITFGRVKVIKPQQAAPLAQVAERLQNHSFGTWTAAEVELFHSDLSPNGATHTPIAAFSLEK